MRGCDKRGEEQRVRMKEEPRMEIKIDRHGKEKGEGREEVNNGGEKQGWCEKRMWR